MSVKSKGKQIGFLPGGGLSPFGGGNSFPFSTSFPYSTFFGDADFWQMPGGKGIAPVQQAAPPPQQQASIPASSPTAPSKQQTPLDFDGMVKNTEKILSLAKQVNPFIQQLTPMLQLFRGTGVSASSANTVKAQSAVAKSIQSVYAPSRERAQIMVNKGSRRKNKKRVRPSKLV